MILTAVLYMELLYLYQKELTDRLLLRRRKYLQAMFWKNWENWGLLKEVWYTA